MMNSINNINYKITKIFQNPNINFFIIMLLILLISCYTFINMSLKYMITSFVSNPIVILFILIFVILIGFYNINIAVLVLLLLFIILYGTTIFNNNTNNNKILNKIEGFTDDSNDDDDNDNDNDDNDDNDNQSDDSDDDYEDDKKKLLSTIKQNLNESKTNDTVESIKNTIFGTMNQLKDSGENEYKKSLLENKTIQYKNEKKINKQKQRNINNSSNSNSNNSRTSNSNNSKKESFQTINKRAFDPNKEEDTNFLITKEILQDMINRVDYNFESSKYLKKYLKHRIEEIVELNKLLDDNDD